MGSLRDDLEAFVNNIKDDISLEFNTAEYFNRVLPNGQTQKEYFIDQWVELDWSLPSWNSVYPVFGASLNPGMITDPIEWTQKQIWNTVSGVLYGIGEGIEDAIEGLIEIIFDIGTWLLDTLWTDFFLNWLVKWVVWIISAGLRVVVAAPSYMLGRFVTTKFLDKLAGLDLNEWLDQVVSYVLPADSPEGSRVDLRETFVHAIQENDIEGLVGQLLSGTSAENSIMEQISVLFGQVGVEPDGN